MVRVVIECRFFGRYRQCEVVQPLKIRYLPYEGVTEGNPTVFDLAIGSMGEDPVRSMTPLSSCWGPEFDTGCTRAPGEYRLLAAIERERVGSGVNDEGAQLRMDRSLAKLLILIPPMSASAAWEAIAPGPTLV